MDAVTLIKSIGPRGADIVTSYKGVDSCKCFTLDVRVYVNEWWTGTYVVLHVPATAVSFATATPGVGLMIWKER